MHMISKKDLSEAEMDTLTKSCSPTIVITANGEVQTQEEAIVYVKELDILSAAAILVSTKMWAGQCTQKKIVESSVGPSCSGPPREIRTRLEIDQRANNCKR